MSAMSKLKKKVGYETNVPRCEICRHLQTSYNMAARLIEALEIKGVIGIKDGIRTVFKR